jgi:hypothetical protein
MAGGPRYRHWYTIIRAEYSGRKLSFESDRLPALSDLASVVASEGNGIYCAGIWWEDVAWGLCWRHWGGTFFSFAQILAPHPRPSKYLAPSVSIFLY